MDVHYSETYASESKAENEQLYATNDASHNNTTYNNEDEIMNYESYLKNLEKDNQSEENVSQHAEKKSRDKVATYKVKSEPTADKSSRVQGKKRKRQYSDSDTG